MNFEFDVFLRLEPIWLFFFFAVFYFIFISYIFRTYYNKLFFFLQDKTVVNVRTYYTNFIADFLSLNLFCLRYLILLVLIFFFFFNYTFSFVYEKLFNYFQFFNYSWIYGNLIIFFFLVYLFILYFTYYNNFLKNIEHLFGIFFIFLNMYYYLFVNNLISIIFLFELQSIVFIYFIAILHFNYYNMGAIKSRNFFFFKSLNFQWYLNSLFFQFWISFIGVIFLMYGTFYIYRSTSFFDWSNIEIFFFFYKYSWGMLSWFDFIMVWLIFFIGLLLKIGFFPFFLWKPEIYKNFNVFILFFYMFMYLFFVLIFFFFFFNNYLLLIKDLWYIYIYYLFTIASVVILFYLYSLQDIRSFLAYSSALNLCYLLLVLTVNNYTGFSVFIFYLIIYSFYVFNFFIFLFLLSNNFLWFFTDLQMLSEFVFLVCFFFGFFFGLAGVPPFLGFFSKISVVSLMLFEEQYFFFFMSLFIGLFASFFYLQVYRFSGFSLKTIHYYNRVLTLKFSGILLFLNYFILFINILSIFFLSDLFIFASWIANNI